MEFLTRITELAARIRARIVANTEDLRVELAEAQVGLLKAESERDAALELLEDLAGPVPEPAPELVPEPDPDPEPDPEPAPDPEPDPDPVE